MIGRTLSHYKVLNEISRGGMGIVYRALDLKLHREVALKVLPPDLVSDPTRKRRFVQEAQAAAAIKHANVAVVYAIDEIDGETFIAMELIEGEKLSERLKREALPVSTAMDLAIQIADGLGEAHDHRIVHRDLKPANVVLTHRGHPKIIDFGLAKLFEPIDDEEEETRSALDTATRGDTGPRTVIGTVRYMSPEQARGQPTDARSDVFTFGSVLFELLTGRPPFVGATQPDTVSAILTAPAPALADSARNLPHHVSVGLQAVLDRCLAKDRSERFPSAREVAAELRLVRESVDRRKRPSLGIAAFCLVIFLSIGSWWLANRTPSAPPPVPEPVRVLVADFDNQTGETVFDGALEQALAIGLEGASFISAYDRARARGQSAELSPEREGALDEMMTQLVCRSQGIDLALTGTVQVEGSGYRLRVWARDPLTMEPVTDASRTAGDKAGMLRAMDLLASELRGALGDVTPASSLAFQGETFTTGSLQAMHSYAIGQELVHTGRYEDSVVEFEKALAADPEFGRAYSGLGVALANLDRLDAALQNFDNALAMIHRMSERERLRTRGVYYIVTRNYPQAIDEYTALTEKFPADSSGFGNLALAHFYERSYVEALRIGRRATEVTPSSLQHRMNAAWYALYAGDFEAAALESNVVLDENAAYENAYVIAALAQLARGELAEAALIYRRLAEVSDRGASMAAMGLADIALYRGHLEDARKLLEPAVAIDLNRDASFQAANKLAVLGHLYGQTGQMEAAMDAVETALETEASLAVVFRAATVYIRAGSLDEAAELAEELSRRNDSESRLHAALIRAEIALAESDTDTAIELLRDARNISDSWIGRLALGRAYVESGAFAEASSELDACLRRKGEATAVFLDDVPSFHMVPLAQFYLARSEEGLGSAGARSSYREFLRIKEGGIETEHVKAAKQRLRALE